MYVSSADKVRGQRFRVNHADFRLESIGRVVDRSLPVWTAFRSDSFRRLYALSELLTAVGGEARRAAIGGDGDRQSFSATKRDLDFPALGTTVT